MSPFVPVWTRQFGSAPGRSVQVSFACFSTGPIAAELPADPAELGIPSVEALETLELGQRRQADDPAWFERWRTEGARAIAQQHIGPHAARLQEVDHALTIHTTLEDPKDLGYLQAAWALARWWSSRGCTVVLDGMAGRFVLGEAVAQLPAAAPFDVRREVLLVMDPQPRAPDEEHWFHTRGLRKAGRPDIVCAASTRDGNLVANVFLSLSDAMFKGAMPAAEQTVQLSPEVSLRLRTPDEGICALLHLENDALQLVDHEGESLGGLAAWMKL